MPIMQFGNCYFDPADIIAIDTKAAKSLAGDHYFVYLKGGGGPMLLTEDAARKCLIAFIDEANNAPKPNEQSP